MGAIGTKNKIQNVLTLKHIYQFYIKDIDRNSKYYIDYRTFRTVCEEFNKELSKEILEGYFFTMPYRLGTIRIKKRKIDIQNLKPDFGLYNKTGLKNKHLNEHSDGYYGRFYWNKRIATIVKNRSIYSFIPTRDNKRSISRLTKADSTHINKYFE